MVHVNNQSSESRRSRWRTTKRILKAGARPLVKALSVAGPTLGTALGQLTPIGTTTGLVGGKIVQKIAKKVLPKLQDNDGQ